MARDFGASPATLKRKLNKHGTSLLGAARHRCASAPRAGALLVHGASNEQVAGHLNFHDAANFRRSFKRWTGLAPSAPRRALALG